MHLIVSASISSISNNILLRKEVLALYRHVIRLSKTWIAQEPANTPKEREYIRDEVRSQFRANLQVSDPAKIRELLDAGRKRVDIACHYRIPYERPPYLPPDTTYEVDPKAKTFKQRKPKRQAWSSSDGSGSF